MLIVIEGLPCAGKSSLVNHLRTEMGYFVVPEISETLKNGEHFPGNGLNYEEIMRISNWFLRKEIERNILARELLEKGNVAMDRGFLTSLAYNTAYEKLTGIEVAELLNAKIFSEIERGNILIPTAYIYLKISIETMRLRLKIRKDRPSSILPKFWLDSEFSITMSRFYDDYFMKNSILSKQIEADKDMCYVFNKCREFLSDMRKCP